MDIRTTDHGLLRLLQLSSVSLPVGGYAFSQGLEYAVDCGWISSAGQVEDWVRRQLLHSIAYVDLPILRLARQACADNDRQALCDCNDLALACRETAELRLTDTAMGDALRRLLLNLDVPLPALDNEEHSFVCLFALAAEHWRIESDTTALGFCWAWLENQVAAATKLVPLGQTQAQALLDSLQTDIPKALAIANTLEPTDIGAGLPALAIASARHETQYSRLFRS